MRNVYHFLSPLQTERPLLHLPRHLSQTCRHVCVNKAICFSIAFLIKVKLNKSITVHEAKERERVRKKTSCQKLGVINNMPAATKHCQCEFSTRKKAINKEGNLKQMPSEGPCAKCKTRGHPGSFQMSLCLNYMLSALDEY